MEVLSYMRMRYSVLLAIIAGQAWGCVCGAPWPSVKDDWKDAPVVIYGTVVFANPETGELFKPQVVRIRADQAFKGASVGQVFEMPLGGTDCDAKFKLGAHSVLFLYPGEKGTWGVIPCRGSTGPDALAFLRELPKSAEGTRLSGEVELYEQTAKDPFRRIGGVAGVLVKITDDHGTVQDVVTNQDGVYEIYGLAPGTYSASMAAPPGLRIKFPLTTGSQPVKGKESAVVLEANAAVTIGFVLEADTRLSGRVVGAPARPHLCFQLEPIDEPGGRLGFDCAKDDGTFAMELMAPGKYRLVANEDIEIDGHKSTSTLYYPGVRPRQEAAVMTVEAGKYVTGLNWSLPSNEKRVTLSGRAEYADGVPVQGGVTFSSEQNGYTEQAAIRSDGSFAFSVVAGMKGEVSAGTALISTRLPSCPQFQVSQERGMLATAETPRLTLTAGSDHRDLKLVLPFAHCESRPRK